MWVKNPKFEISAVKPSQYPQNDMPQIVLVGKSNVGKSSFINTMLNRKKLASIIYEDDKKREELNKLTFIYVVDEIKKRINKIKKKIIVVNAPLLFESNLDQVCDFVIAIIAERKVQIERIMKRDNIQDDEAEKRLNMKNTDDFYIENADYIIHNKGDIKDIEKQLKDIKI